MEKKKIRLFIFIFCMIAIVFGAFVSLRFAQTQSTYNGLPTVACIDPTKPILQQFSLHISISIQNKQYPLDSFIGYDSGNCLHSIFTKDGSGTVFIQSNNNESFTLGQFFDTWKKTFSDKQIFNFLANNLHHITVMVNSMPVITYRQTLLKPNEKINIIYN